MISLNEHACVDNMTSTGAKVLGFDGDDLEVEVCVLLQMFKAGYSGPRSVPKSLVAFTDDEEEEEDGEPLRL